MKKINQFLIIALIILIIGCEKESKDIATISIKTGKNEYLVNSKIDITIKNNSNKQAQYIKCSDNNIQSEIHKYYNDTWNSYYYFLCTNQGILDISEIKHDTIVFLDETGKFKLRYSFIVNNEALTVYSNEFLITNLSFASNFKLQT